MDFTGRFNKLLKDNNLSNYRLAMDLGISQTTVKNYKDGKTEPNTLTLEQLAKYFGVNWHWLKTGEGPVEPVTANTILARKVKQELKKFKLDENKLIIAPLIGQYAYGGYLSGFADKEYLEQQPIYISMHPHNGGNYVAFEVRGDSMDDNSRRGICSGDLVLGRELQREHWAYRLHIPKVFIIIHTTDGIVMKEVTGHNVDKGTILCHSWNPSPEYEDYTLNLNDIIQLFYIKEVSRINKY